jgi:hypothetical protein
MGPRASAKRVKDYFAAAEAVEEVASCFGFSNFSTSRRSCLIALSATSALALLLISVARLTRFIVLVLDLSSAPLKFHLKIVC